MPIPHHLRAICAILSAVVLAGITLSCASAPTPTPAPQPFSFAQICDTQLGMGGYEHDVKSFQQAVKQINTLSPDFVLICGDLVGKANAKTFGDFKSIKAGFDMPCHVVPGNHDVGNKPDLKSLAFYRETFGKDYYDFEHKGHSFACANTQLWKAPVEVESETHDAWFQATLKTAYQRQSPVFVVGHYPLFTARPDEAENYYNLPPAKRAELLGLFEQYGVVAMLTGHAHRFIQNDYKGIQLVTGQATSRTKGPLGFRLWTIGPERPYTHEAVDLEGF